MSLSYPYNRMRRTRSSSWIRDLVAEHNLTTNDLVQPYFVVDGNDKKEPIESLPGIFRYSIDNLLFELDQAVKLGIRAVALFPYVDKSLKTHDCAESYNPDNLICRTLRAVKARFPDLGLIADVALDPYNIKGHDGIVMDNIIQNDETIAILVKQSLVQAESGADIIAPSDMMDGRVKLIRQALEDHNFHNIMILSYAAKYASNLYGPFRDAVGSKINLSSDKKTYQMDYRNSRESLIEAGLDVTEGADMLMIKPASFYLDVINKIRQNTSLPIFAYQVSGEYAMLKFAEKNGIADNYTLLLFESLIACKRAGCDGIFSYGALDIARFLKNN
jgi:porphobilinogen synthase